MNRLDCYQIKGTLKLALDLRLFTMFAKIGPFFEPFWNQTGHQIWIELESVSLISSFIQCEFCYLLSKKTFDMFKSVIKPLTCWSCSSVLFYSIIVLCIPLYPEVLLTDSLSKGFKWQCIIFFLICKNWSNIRDILPNPIFVKINFSIVYKIKRHFEQ